MMALTAVPCLNAGYIVCVVEMERGGFTQLIYNIDLARAKMKAPFYKFII